MQMFDMPISKRGASVSTRCTCPYNVGNGHIESIFETLASEGELIN